VVSRSPSEPRRLPHGAKPQRSGAEEIQHDLALFGRTEAGGVVGIPGVEGAEFIITVSEREPVLVYALKQADGTALNLESGSPTVTFSMGPAAGGALKVSAVASEIVDAANGIVRYRWGATDTDTKGDFLGRFNVSENGGLGSAYPLNRTIVVRVIANVT
jgi:hypothetical protein